ncbi:hypothetical protein SETIT_5G178000v2 [Setaria italica]|uniref:Uncharacterized protein n=2 Tax=Setaria TaxID=4554 RepID=A0A368R627_SETIT|nr:hypothetical protein SETIT_5G178000v2 [Setaria italica]TKW14618.1 hypothetical protein SEVIR_5G178200v2 [Setaria viridis]
MAMIAIRLMVLTRMRRPGMLRELNWQRRRGEGQIIRDDIATISCKR